VWIEILPYAIGAGAVGVIVYIGSKVVGYILK
jgi:hypothetical protein